jgi:hypothetical protein
MRALRITAWGGPLHEATIDPPVPNDSDLLVRVEACGSRYEVGLAAGFVRSGRLRPVVSSVVGPGLVAATLDAVRAGTILGRATLVW